MTTIKPVWRAINTAPLNHGKPFIVWLPIKGIVVSALPRVEYAPDGNTEIAIVENSWSMTDRAGRYYGLELDEQPSYWLDGLVGPEETRTTGTIEIGQTDADAPGPLPMLLLGERPTIQNILNLRSQSYEDSTVAWNKQFPEKPITAGQYRYYVEHGQFHGQEGPYNGPTMLDGGLVVYPDGTMTTPTIK